MSDLVGNPEDRFFSRRGFIVGARALQSFLTGALKLKSDPPRVTQYVKTGGWEVAKTEVGALDVITRRSSFGTPKNWKIVATDQVRHHYKRVLGV